MKLITVVCRPKPFLLILVMSVIAQEASFALGGQLKSSDPQLRITPIDHVGSDSAKAPNGTSPTLKIPPYTVDTISTERAPNATISDVYGKLPLIFEANNGQTAADVKFISRGLGYTLFLTSAEAVLVLRRADTDQSGQNDKNLRPSKSVQRSHRPEHTETSIRLKLEGIRPNAKVVGLDPLTGKSNYFVGKDSRKWRTEIPHYAKVKYEEGYPGIDLVYYGNQRQLEYDFIVKPGANPNIIAFSVEGADKVWTDDSGDLVIETASGTIRQRAPIIYQDIDGVKAEIIGGYVIKDNKHIGFEVATYNTSMPLVIDPVLSYSTYLGGSGSEGGFLAGAIAVDSTGNAYVTGHTASLNFPTQGPFQSVNRGGADVFVTKLNPQGSTLVYSTYLGGAREDEGFGIAVDSSGNVYVTGETGSTDFPTRNPIQGTLAPQPNVIESFWRDAFVAKLNPTGSDLIYSTYLGGDGGDRANGIFVDIRGDAYITGQTGSANFPTVNPVQGFKSGSADAFVTKISTSGSSLIYSTYLGGGNIDWGAGITVDSVGNAHITGTTRSNNFPTRNPIQATNGNPNDPSSGNADDVFVTKLNAQGNALIYSTYLGGASSDNGEGIALDLLENAYVTGSTQSVNFPTMNPLQPTKSGEVDAFVIKLRSDGMALIYSTFLGGNLIDAGRSIVVDAVGNAYVTGYTNSDDFPIVNALQPTRAIGTCPADGTNVPCTDIFVTKIKADGAELTFSTYLGGSNLDFGRSIALDLKGNAYVTGTTISFNFPTTPGSFDRVYGGVSDVFVAKIEIENTPTPALFATPISHDFSNVNVGSTKDFDFTVQNTGAGTLIGSATTSAPFSIVGSNSFNLAANQNALITVRFSPTAAGVANGFVNFTSSGGNASLTVTGTGVAVVVDTDGDGMPDAFEIANGLNPNDPNDALLDADGDGISNLVEFQKNTNPRSRFTDHPLVPDIVGEPTPQPVYDTCPTESVGRPNLVVLIHGWNGSSDDWPRNMAEKIKQVIQARGATGEWDICRYDWEQDAASPGILVLGLLGSDAETAWVKAGPHGQSLGNLLFKRGYRHIHFIAHSAGSNVLQTAVETIIGQYEKLHIGPAASCNVLPIQDPNACQLPMPTIHSTFLDAYVAEVFLRPGLGRRHATDRYGRGAQWAEHYVSKTLLGDDTDPNLTKAFNFDVTDLDPQRFDFCNQFIGECFRRSHAWPHKWYEASIEGSDPDGISRLSSGFGFAMSFEYGKSSLPAHDAQPGVQRYYPPGEECNLKTEAAACGRSVTTPTGPSLFVRRFLDMFVDFPSALDTNALIASATGIVSLLNSTTVRATMGSPVWFSVGLNTTAPKNFLNFSYQFLAGTRGFLSVFFDGKLVHQRDQQFALPGLNTATDIWLGDVMAGQHVLSFRLDTFDGSQGVIEISNVKTGLMELTTDANVNNLVTFAPLTSTIKTTASTSGCPAGFVGKFSFNARLTDKSGSPSLTNLSAKVTTLSNDNLLQNADGGPAGVGATLTIPSVGNYTDGVLSPKEFVDVPFSICLKQNKPFSFFVDVWGVTQ